MSEKRSAYSAPLLPENGQPKVNPVPIWRRLAVTLDEAALLLSVSRATVEELTAREEGGIGVVYVGSEEATRGSPRVPLSEIRRYLKEQRTSRARRLNRGYMALTTSLEEGWRP